MLRAQGKLDEAADVQERALRIKKKAYGQEHPEVAVTYGCLANVLQDQGKLDEAAAMHKKSLTISIKTLGEEHPSVAITLGNLAGVSHVTAM